MSSQKRTTPRVPIEIRVEYKRVNAFISDFTRDVSGGGLFLQTDYPLALGTECLFTLEIPGVDDEITLPGVVRRVEEAEGDEPAGMGVELVFDDDAERKAFTDVIDSLMVEHLGNALYRRLVRMRGEATSE